MAGLVFQMFLLAASKGIVTAEVAGFTCTAQSGEIARLNIDLKKRRYDMGGGLKALDSITETQITLEGPNPYLMSTPMGPIMHTLSLDRETLVLTDQTLIPDRNINKIIAYKCALGPKIDFTEGRKF